MPTKLNVFIMLGCVLLTGCFYAKPDIQELGDCHLNRTQILKEISKLENSRNQIRNARGLSGTNIACALFFWPGILINEYNAESAEQAINARKEHLVNLYVEKGYADNEKNLHTEHPE